VEHLEREQVVGVPLDEAFAFYGEAQNLERITPRWLHFEILEAPAELLQGALIRYRLRLFGVPIHWLTRIEAWEPPHRFVDRQLSGPYRRWVHTHELEAVAGGTLIRDHVEYDVPFARLARWPVARALAAIFDFRARATAEALAGGGSPPG
jgi:ligand-binding SRPBCC domain-containing protein